MVYGENATSHPASSLSTQTLQPHEVVAAAKTGIVVQEDEAARPCFRIIGTTVFNNKVETITDPGFSFGDYLVARLKAKGYPATKSASEDNPLTLALYSTHPYKGEGMQGAGVFQRSFLGIRTPAIAHCNYRGTLIRRDPKAFVSQPINFGGTSYFSQNVSLASPADSWEQVSSADREKLKVAIQKSMQKQADLILKQLGL